MRFTADVSRGDWIAPRLHGWGVVGSTAPRGFEACARVFHPVAWSASDGSTRLERPTSWAGVAAHLGTVAHPAMQWERIVRGREDVADDGWTLEQPTVGGLDPALLTALADLLPDVGCTIGVWAGRGGIDGASFRLTFTRGGGDSGPAPLEIAPEIGRATREGPLLELPGRSYVLLAGRVAELRVPGWKEAAGLGAAAFAESPNLIWPKDRSWFVATEIDFDSTVVAGPRELIDRVLIAPGIEAMPVEEDTDLSSAGDEVNPPPD